MIYLFAIDKNLLHLEIQMVRHVTPLHSLSFANCKLYCVRSDGNISKPRFII